MPEGISGAQNQGPQDEQHVVDDEFGSGYPFDLSGGHRLVFVCPVQGRSIAWRYRTA